MLKQTNKLSDQVFFILAYIALLLTSQACASVLVAFENPIDDISCKEKTKGISDGLVCLFNGSNFYLKNVEQHGKQIQNTTPCPITACYNFPLLDSFGVVTPSETRFMSLYRSTIGTILNRLTLGFTNAQSILKYVATKEIEGFVPAEQILLNISGSKKYPLPENKKIRKKLLTCIGGEKGLAKLAVAATLCYDIAAHTNNWGAVNNTIAIVDTDVSPSKMSEYFDLAIMMTRDIKIAFTVETLKEMIQCYEQLLDQSDEMKIRPRFLASKEFKIYIEALITACHNVINTYIPNHRAMHINDFLGYEISQQQEKIGLKKDNKSRALVVFTKEQSYLKHGFYKIQSQSQQVISKSNSHLQQEKN